VIGNWAEHLGVYVCPGCNALVNIPVETSTCPGVAKGSGLRIATTILLRSLTSAGSLFMSRNQVRAARNVAAPL
jgi:hypothetical protein